MGPEAEADIKEPIVAILNPRLRGARIAEIVEMLYANATYSMSERLDVVRSRRRNPYPAQFGQLHGLRWDGHIHCGHNPFLQARVVDGLRLARDPDGEERLIWEERPTPQPRRRKSVAISRARRPTTR